MAKESLEKKMERLEKEMARLDAYRQIQNVMGKYMVVHVTGPILPRSLDLFALKTPGCLVEIADWGLYRGPQQIRELYLKGHGDTTVNHPGAIVEHDLTTPIIEVAKDCKTAKAVWFSPGWIVPVVEEYGKGKFLWRWLRIAAAFAVEDGQWKLWKYHVISTFFADYYKSPADYQPPGRGLVKGLNPNPPHL